jgi:hypothetical protein
MTRLEAEDRHRGKLDISRAWKESIRTDSEKVNPGSIRIERTLLWRGRVFRVLRTIRSFI